MPRYCLLYPKKHSDGKQVRSAVRVLDANERVQEIARMAGGLNVTPEALRHAEAMLAAR